MQKQHSPEAQKVLEDLDADLARSSTKLGKTLSWTAAEREVREMIANTIDRRADVARAYDACDRGDAKNLVRLSAEWRMLDAAVARLLKQVETDVPQPMSLLSVKAQRAARARWDRDRAAS